MSRRVQADGRNQVVTDKHMRKIHVTNLTLRRRVFALVELQLHLSNYELKKPAISAQEARKHSTRHMHFIWVSACKEIKESRLELTYIYDSVVKGKVCFRNIQDFLWIFSSTEPICERKYGLNYSKLLCPLNHNYFPALNLWYDEEDWE